MAGRIKREDIDLVRERARIEDVVGEQVTLRSAGVGSQKGLCPFHDERTPSFHVRPQLGLWHCFGCAEGGDVFSFVQKTHHMSFVESVEYLAGKYGVTLRYEDGGGPRSGPDHSQRRRLLEANRVAEEFYRAHLLTPEGKDARDFLTGRGFTREQVEHFGVGSSPSGWDGLTRHLRSKSFTDEELVASGLAIQGNRGPYDRFRGRVMWPIRDVTGATIGFGARRLGDDPNQPKYLNTPETAIYHKSQVLYGLDLAKREISRKRRLVVVEGYTDVMAAHCAGEGTAVATCGTAFGKEHTQLVRRLLGDTEHPGAGVVLSDGRARGGEVIFTFDGDEAGKAAARRAYAEDQAFAVQTFVAVDPNGMDPCDLRLSGGDEALRNLIDSRVPLFEFVLRSVLSTLNLNTAEGRIQGLRTAAPILAGIKDEALRSEYGRQVAGWLGLDPAEVDRALRQARGRGRNGPPPTRPTPPGDPRGGPPGGLPGGLPGGMPGAPSTPTAPMILPLHPDGRGGHSAERLALAATLQRPLDVVGSGFETLRPQSFMNERNQDIFRQIVAAGSLDGFLDYLAKAETQFGVGEESTAQAGRRWAASLVEAASPQVAEDLRALMVLSLPVEEQNQRDYSQGLVRALVRRELQGAAQSLRAQMARLDADSEQFLEVSRRHWDVQQRLRLYSNTDE